MVIEPDGKWSSQVASTKKESSEQTEDYFDDDLEISEINILGSRSFDTPNRSIASLNTPLTGQSREGSTLPRASSSAKRPAPVIDLTLSSDEDDEPITRPAKRQQAAPNAPSSFSRPYNNPPSFYNS